MSRMKLKRTVIVLDAADLEAESAFWTALLGGTVHRDDDWHSIVVDGEWRLGIQLAPGHVPPDWPDGNPQQLHLDLHVEDLQEAHDEATALGARAAQAGPRPRGRGGLPGVRRPGRPPLLPVLGPSLR